MIYAHTGYPHHIARVDSIGENSFMRTLGYTRRNPESFGVGAHDYMRGSYRVELAKQAKRDYENARNANHPRRVHHPTRADYRAVLVAEQRTPTPEPKSLRRSYLDAFVEQAHADGWQTLTDERSLVALMTAAYPSILAVFNRIPF